MRILYITNGFPYPLTSGYLRHYFFIRELAKHHSITLASLVNGDYRREHAEEMAQYTERILSFMVSAKGTSETFSQKAGRFLRRMTRRIPAVRKMTDALQQLVRTEEFDVVLFSGREILPAIKTLGQLPLVVDLCDAIAERIRGKLRHSSLGTRPLHYLEYKQMQRTEQELIQAASHVLFASSRDRDALLLQDSESASVIPNGVDLEFWKRSAPIGGKRSIIFTGAMDYSPNVDAATTLIEQIFPLVRERISDAELFIVGRDPVEELKRAGEQSGITVTGFVDDVRPYLENATVFAAPLRFGTGIQNKLLEAMAMEMPIVTTSLAAKGLRTENDESPPLDIAENPEQFASFLCRRLTEPEQNSTPNREAREYVEQHFVWKTCGEKLNSILKSVTNSEKTRQVLISSV